MNENMPCVGGDNFIHISQIDYIVSCANPLPEILPSNIGSVEKAIGGYCAELIENDSTLC